MDINFKDFPKKVLQSKLPVLVEFWASWCLPCQAAGTTLKRVEKKYQKKTAVFKINVDKNPQVSSMFQIMGLPTFILFKNGKVTDRKVGSQTFDNLEQMIKNSLNNE